MPIIARLMTIFALAVLPQAKQSVLLPAPVHLAGTVVDPDGHPVSGVMIEHSNAKERLPQTDAEGNFAFDTDAPAVVFQKPGFRSLRIQVRPASNIRVTLHPFAQQLPACGPVGQLVGMDMNIFSGALYFRPMKEIKSTEPKLDVDYFYRYYYIGSKKEGIAIRHGTGPMWGDGQPFDEDVWQSSYFEEVLYPAKLTSMVDARGQMPDGTRWRTVGLFGNSASYSGVPPQAAQILDRFLDTACIPPPAAHSLAPAKTPEVAPENQKSLVPVSRPQ